MDATSKDEALWRARVDKVLKGEPYDSLVSQTADGIEIAPLYPAAGAASPVLRQRPDRPWSIVQRVDHPEPEAANRLALADLVGGADALKLVFDGSAASHGFGVAPDDLAAALAGVELDLIALSLDLPPGAEVEAIEAVTRVVSSQRLVPASLDVDFGIDPLGTMAFTGPSAQGWEAATGGLLRKLMAKGYAGPFLRADTRVHHDAGATPAQELGAVLSTAIAYLRLLEDAGVALDEARAKISFQMSADADQFVTLAKFRALRRLWASVERSCGLEPVPVRVSAETSFRMATRRDAAVNWLRTTSALFAAGTGGADQICVLPHTVALGLADAFSRRIARNQQLVLLAESRLDHVCDPGAGSGAVEALTQALARRGWEAMAAIEAEGGMASSLRTGHWQRRLEEGLRSREEGLALGRTTLVGVTAFLDEAGQPPSVLAPAPEIDVAREMDFIPLRAVRDETLAAGRKDAA